MGVLNVTPDSFSDGGLYLAVDAAVEHGLVMLAEGADIVDVGGESTRPGAARVSTDEECRRVIPVVEQLVSAGATVSVDTMSSVTARRAVEAGAAFINDVSGGLADPRMLAVTAELGVSFIAMHWRGHSTQMDALTSYNDVVRDVYDELAARVDALLDAGVAGDRIILDPGIGFAKTREQDWTVMAHIEVLKALGYPVLLGASRKRSVAALLPKGAPKPGDPRRVAALDTATSTVSLLAAHAGVWGVRVHDVLGTRMAFAVADAWGGILSSPLSGGLLE